MDTLESGVILVSNPATGVWDERSAWRLTDEVRIGTRDGEGPEVFGDVRSIALDDVGRVYVLDAHVQEVRVFDRAGIHVRTIGGHGGGPGEIGFATGIIVDPAGRLWIPDYGNQRYSLFDTSGVLVKEMPFRGGVRFTEWTTGVFSPSGDFYDRIPVGIGPSSAGYARYDTLRGAFVDTARSTGEVLPDGTPGFPWRRVTVTPRGSWVGVTLEYRLWEITRDGFPLRIVERDYEANPLTPEQRDSARLAVRELKRHARGDVDLEVPDEQPIFDRMIVDDRDHLWVQLSPKPDATTTTFDVFDPEGVYLGAVETPYRVAWPYATPVVRGGRIAFVTKDELDVPYVVVLGIEERR
jgi:sugar lactone lactonase YvrE